MAEKSNGITIKKEENISEWFTEVITKAELIDYSDVSGCMVIKPTGYEIWERIVAETDKRFKKVGIKNAYFPLFIPEKHLIREKEHVEGFSPEVAWVTQAGDTILPEKLAVRPTSETIMYPSYSKWIRSWRDLPLRLNQWNSVVRWEFKTPVPLLRSREFLWNEGHTVFATKEEAEAERDQILDIYQDILKNYLAIYAVAGYKSQKEKFAGAEYTCSLESFLESGKAIQGPDFHHDGQNFAKAFDITFLDKEGKKQYAWQNTFAISTRMIGVMVIIHGDNKGLVLPPAIAPTQVVIIPIIKDDSKEKVLAECNKISAQLKSFRVSVDKREEYSPGWKFNEYELKGIPIRIELGPRDLENSQAVLARRDTGEKKTIKLSEIKTEVAKTLKQMQKDLYNKSKDSFVNNTIKTNKYNELMKAVDNKKIVLAPFCNDPACEDFIKTESPATTTRNSPIGSKLPKGAKCVRCGKDAKLMIYFAKTY